MTRQGEMVLDQEDSVSFRVIGVESAAERDGLDWGIALLADRLGTCGAALRQAAAPGAGGRDHLVLALGAGAEITRSAAACDVTLPEGAESFAIFRNGREAHAPLCLYGADLRGLIYAITELADRLRTMPTPEQAFDMPLPLVGEPATRVRSLSKCFSSEVEDLPWFRDRDGWQAYLDELVTHRFNRLTLTLGMHYNYPYGNEFLSDVYLHFAYPFLVDVPGHGVTIANLPEAERRENLDTLKFIAREAARRGLEFQLALWTQNYDFDHYPGARHQVQGLGPDNLAAYCRDALALILAEVPEISGLTLRVHVESGIPEGDYAFWKTYFGAVTGAGRTLRLDLHAKGIDETLIGMALETGMPVTVSPKYTLEHMGLAYHQASIRPLELDLEGGKESARKTLYSGDDAHRFDGLWKFSEGSRKFMRYSYGDLLTADRPYDLMFRIWPGTQRVLLWGDPVLAAGFGANGSFSGAAGIELCDPLSFKGRMGAAQDKDRIGYNKPYFPRSRDWEKFTYTYRVWGRSLYDPRADGQAFERGMAAKYGPAAPHCATALASASRIMPLIAHAHAPTASNNSYWPEMYENMSILHDAPPLPYGYELPVGSRFGTVGATDPQMFLSPAGFARALRDGAPIRKLAPLTWANWLEQFADTAEAGMARALDETGEESTALYLLRVDVTIMAGIGRFFAEKIRAATLWEYYLLSGAAGAGREALRCYRAARAAWGVAAEISREVYLEDIAFGPLRWLRGRWDDRLPAIDADIEDMAARLAADGAGEGTRQDALAMARILHWSAAQIMPFQHVPRPEVTRGEPVRITCIPFGTSRRDVRLLYRQTLQTATWQEAPMTWAGGACHATIPGEYTDSPYAILYYFEIACDGVSSFFPGLGEDVSSTPYFHIKTRN
ncbi:hypothetical protein [Roseovarius sp.]|uniref:hypothetical protein n=1 Tax=Roseovarius sp. TaxID=1486281 RepID=UPI003BABBF51